MFLKIIYHYHLITITLIGKRDFFLTTYNHGHQQQKSELLGYLCSVQKFDSWLRMVTARTDELHGLSAQITHRIRQHFRFSSDW
jgi:hypothetical protein